MNNVKSPKMGSLKELAEKLEKESGGLRPAERKYGIPFQTLQYWKKGAARLQETFDWLEKARQIRKLSKAAAWDEIINNKKMD